MLGVAILIFVTLGTQDKPFPRLLEAIQKQIDNGTIPKDEKIIVQAGCTRFKSKDMEIKHYMGVKKFEQLIEESNLIISHAGVGTILTALRKNKRIIAAARLKQYGEHVNDHQLQILENFRDAGYLLALENFEKLNEVLEEAKGFKPAKFKSNRDYFLKQLEHQIDIL